MDYSLPRKKLKYHIQGKCSTETMGDCRPQEDSENVTTENRTTVIPIASERHASEEHFNSHSTCEFSNSASHTLVPCPTSEILQINSAGPDLREKTSPIHDPRQITLPTANPRQEHSTIHDPRQIAPPTHDPSLGTSGTPDSNRILSNTPTVKSIPPATPNQKKTFPNPGGQNSPNTSKKDGNPGLIKDHTGVYPKIRAPQQKQCPRTEPTWDPLMCTISPAMNNRLIPESDTDGEPGSISRGLLDPEVAVNTNRRSPSHRRRSNWSRRGFKERTPKKEKAGLLDSDQAFLAHYYGRAEKSVSFKC